MRSTFTKNYCFNLETKDHLTDKHVQEPHCIFWLYCLACPNIAFHGCLLLLRGFSFPHQWGNVCVCVSPLPCVSVCTFFFLRKKRFGLSICHNNTRTTYNRTVLTDWMAVLSRCNSPPKYHYSQLPVWPHFPAESNGSGCCSFTLTLDGSLPLATFSHFLLTHSIREAVDKNVIN